MSSPRFILYYWPIPFRAQMLRYMLAYSGQAWRDAEQDTVVTLYQSDTSAQPVPFAGPPVLFDAAQDLWLSQAPAIAMYLGKELGLLPETAAQQALSLKVVCDTIDTMEALTRHCGQQMWDAASWASFVADQFPQWLTIFEEMGTRNGLTRTSGTMLGTDAPGVADFASAALWATICDCLPDLERPISQHAPIILAHAKRLAAVPAIAKMRAQQHRDWGDIWCAGQIEASLRGVIANKNSQTGDTP